MTHESSPATPGIVHLVGAGPGDPGLLTVRGRDLLATCDAIVYDALANPAIIAAATAREDGTAPELHDVGKRGGDERSARQDDINALLVRLAREGRQVVRLKGGDPFVFGRGSEEAQALAAAGVAFEVVPGITAGIAAPAYAGIPVTHRAVATSVTFVTGHEDPAKGEAQTDWAALARVARSGGTIVLYMGVKRLPDIAAALVAGGLPAETPAAAVQWGTYPHQRTVSATLATLAARATSEGIAAPVITVIGAAVALRDEIAWFERRPLFGRRVVVTRARAQAAALANRLAVLGAHVLELPATRVETLDPTPLQNAFARIGAYQWLVVTSQNAVAVVWDALRAAGKDARALAGIKLAAVGPATADALMAHGIVPDVTPTRFVAEGLLEALRGRDDMRGARVLYATSEGAREVLPSGLAELGATVKVVPIYRSVPDEAGARALRETLSTDGADLVTLTSASAVHAYVAAVGAERAAQIPAASIGPVTSEAARAAGVPIVAEAATATIPSLVEAVRAYFIGAARVASGDTPGDATDDAGGAPA